MDDEPDILDLTPPEGIPGALFTEITAVLMKQYKPGTIINTINGCGTKAQLATVAVLEAVVAFYEAVAEAEGQS